MLEYQYNGIGHWMICSNSDRRKEFEQVIENRCIEIRKNTLRYFDKYDLDLDLDIEWSERNLCSNSDWRKEFEQAIVNRYIGHWKNTIRYLDKYNK